MSRRIAVIVVAVMSVFATSCVNASASTIKFNGHTVTYRSVTGEVNDVTVTVDGTESDIIVHDDGAIIDVGPGCVGPFSSGHEAACPLSQSDLHGKIKLDLRDGNDKLDGVNQPSALQALPLIVKGGTEDDALNGGSGEDRMTGGAGNDELEGDGGADRLGGGSGDDLLLGGLEEFPDDFSLDRLSCGGGSGDRAVNTPPDRYSGCEDLI